MERNFSHTMSELRRKRGLNQRAAAADLGISQALLSHYETGAREPGLEFVCRACAYYDVTADYLLGLSDQPNSTDHALNTLQSLCDELDSLSARTRQTLEELSK